MQNKYREYTFQKDPNGPLTRLTASTELMEHFQAGRPVDPEHRIASVQDSAGNPLIFSISNEGVLYVIRRSRDSKTGWEQIALSTWLTAPRIAADFGVIQEQDGRLLLVLHAKEQDKPDSSHLFLSQLLSPDMTTAQWQALGQTAWRHRPLTDQVVPVTITDLLLGSGTRSSRHPIVMVATQQGGTEANRYRINADWDDLTWHAKEVYLPENADEILHLAVGHHFAAGAGFYSLYRLKNDPLLRLQFTSFDPDPYGKRWNVHLLVPQDVEVLAAHPNAQGQTDLYLSGDKLYVYPANAQVVKRGQGQEPLLISDSPLVRDTKDLIVREDSQTLAVWLRTKAGKMVYLHRSAQGGAAWSLPTVLRAGIGQIAPLRNQIRNANELLLVGLNATLNHMWQDPDTTLWKEQPIALEDTDSSQSLTCYATQLHLQDDKGLPLQAHKLFLKTSEWCSLIINGDTVVTDKDNAAELQTDALGNLTVLIRLNSLTAPRLILEADFLAEPLTLDPVQTLVEQLSQLKDGQQLLQIKRDDGTPLVQGGAADAKTADAAIHALQQLLKTREHLEAGTPGKAPLTFTWVPATDAGPGSYSSHGQPSLVNKVLGVLGDVFETLRQGFATIQKWVVEAVDGIVNFFLDLGEKVLHFVVEKVEQLYQAVHWFFKEVFNIDLDDWVQWLGFVFDGEDIKQTQAVLVKLARDLFDFGQQNVANLGGQVDRLCDTLKEKLTSRPPLPLGARGSAPLLATAEAATPKEGHNRFLTQNPAGNFMNYQLLHGGLASDTSLVPIAGPNAATIHGMGTFLTDTIGPLAEEIRNLFENLFGDFQQIGTLSPDELIRRAGTDAMLGMIEIFRRVGHGVIDLLSGMIGYLRDALFAEIKLPFLSQLYKRVVGSEMSAMDGVMLLFAIPLTVFYKLVQGQAPFPADAVHTRRVLSTGNFFSWVYDGTSATAPQRMLASAPAETASVMALSDHVTVQPLNSEFHAVASADALVAEADTEEAADKEYATVTKVLSYFFGFGNAIASLASTVPLVLKVVHAEKVAKAAEAAIPGPSKATPIDLLQFGVSVFNLLTLFPLPEERPKTHPIPADMWLTIATFCVDGASFFLTDCLNLGFDAIMEGYGGALFNGVLGKLKSYFVPNAEQALKATEILSMVREGFCIVVGAAKTVVELGLFVAIFIVECGLYSDDLDPLIFKFINNLVLATTEAGATASDILGLAKKFDWQAIAAGLTCVLLVLNSVLLATRTGISISQGDRHFAN